MRRGTITAAATSFLLGPCLGLIALGTNSAPDEIPPLRPPRPELPPTFWEQHGLTVSIVAVLGLSLIAALFWLALRPKPVPEMAPEEAARRELEFLKGRSADPQLLTRVSHVVRRYLTRAFGLPTGEMTTAEFCRALAEQNQIGSSLANHAAHALRAWDEQKFSPAPPVTTADPVGEAARLIEEGQARIAELKREELTRTAAGACRQTPA